MTDPQLFTTAITPAGVEHLRAAIEKEGGPQVSEPKNTGTVVYILTYDHPHGTDTTVYASHQGAEQGADDIALMYWEEVAGDVAPEDLDEDGEVLLDKRPEIYWHIMGERERESYSITESVIQGASDEFKVTDAGSYTAVALPDGELRIFEPAPDSDDASRMYVLDILGIDVLVRWVNDSFHSQDDDVDALSGPQLRAHLTAEHGILEAQRQDLSDPACSGIHRAFHELRPAEHDHPSFHLDVRVDSDCTSIAPHSGTLMVGNALNVDEWFEVEASRRVAGKEKA